MMTQDEIDLLKASLQNYTSKREALLDSQFSPEETEAFKHYYAELYTQVVAYVRFTKDKSLSEQAKKLIMPGDLFSRTYLWLGLAGVIIIFPAIILMNLTFLDIAANVLIVPAVLSLILIFWVIRMAQRQPLKLADKLEINGHEVDHLLTFIVKKQ